MADDLNSIVQRMIDAGESEENIASVIKGYKPTYQPDPTMQAATMRAMVGASGALIPPRQRTDESGQPINPPSTITRTIASNPLLQGAAHPSTLGDIASLFVPDAGSMSAVIKGAKSLTPNMRKAISAAGQAIQDYDVTHPAKPIGDFLKWLATPSNPAVPLAEDLGKTSMVVQGPEQFRIPYSTPAAPVPNATPVKLADGTWSYIERGTREALPEGATANVITKSGKTWTTTVPAAIDPAADLRQAKLLVNSGVDASKAASQIASGNAKRYVDIMKALMKESK